MSIASTVITKAKFFSDHPARAGLDGSEVAENSSVLVLITSSYTIGLEDSSLPRSTLLSRPTQFVKLSPTTNLLEINSPTANVLLVGMEVMTVKELV